MLNTGSQNGICVYVCSYAKGSGVMPFTTSVFDVETSLQKLSRKKKKKRLNGIPTVLSPHETDVQTLEEKTLINELNGCTH